MDLISIPKSLPISIDKLMNYLDSKFKIKIDINEEFIKNTLDDEYKYILPKKGKNKNNVKVVKKRKKEKSKDTRSQHIKGECIYIEKDKYIDNKELMKTNIKIYNSDEKVIKKCQKCAKYSIKYIVEKIINLKYLSDIKKVYNHFLMEKNNYQIINVSFLNLLDSHKNICNLYKNMKIKLDDLYNILCKYECTDEEIKIPILKYEFLLKNILKITPANEFVKILY